MDTASLEQFADMLASRLARAIGAELLTILRAEGIVPPPADAQSLIAYGDLSIDLAAHRVFHQGRELAIAGRTYTLLTVLVRNAGRVLSREQLLAAAWPDAERVKSDRSVDVQIVRLRRALGADGSRVQTVAGVGYRFQPP